MKGGTLARLIACTCTRGSVFIDHGIRAGPSCATARQHSFKHFLVTLGPSTNGQFSNFKGFSVQLVPRPGDSVFVRCNRFNTSSESNDTTVLIWL